MGEAGLEPAHPYGHRNLNPARLPIPPLARDGVEILHDGLGLIPRLADSRRPSPVAWSHYGAKAI